MKAEDKFRIRSKLTSVMGELSFYSLRKLEKLWGRVLSGLPYSIRIMIESAFRNWDEELITSEMVRNLIEWRAVEEKRGETAFMPARVLLQDFTGVPSIADLAAMRSAAQRLGGEPEKINPTIPADLVIDHSIQVDCYGSARALEINSEKEFSRNYERYAFLHWGQKAFHNFRVVPPATGIVHQVNLEYLARVVQIQEQDDKRIVFPDTLVGTDSHTTMINGLGILGWGVGGIEAEAVMLGQPYYMVAPDVVGFELTGALKGDSNAADLVLTVTEILRKKGVVGKFVEFFGSGLKNLSLPDRATIANMSPEYGATMGFFPVDEKTLQYLLDTGRDKKHVELVEKYCRKQGLFYDAKALIPDYTEKLSLDMGDVEPVLAGPSRPQDKIPLTNFKKHFSVTLREKFGKSKKTRAEFEKGGQVYEISDGSLAIAAITSCTNTSNPYVMMGAGILAKNAVERGLRVKPYVKTSLAPGSKVVAEYLRSSGLMDYLEKLNFHLVGYGCTTCIGNSGPLDEEITQAITEGNIIAASVLSGNRNFEGRINPMTAASYLASPILVVAYALAGSMDFDLYSEPLGRDPDGNLVYYEDIKPDREEILRYMKKHLKPELFKVQYADVFEGNATWNEIKGADSDVYDWQDDSTYIKEPPFFKEFSPAKPDLPKIQGARILALFGDSITTDHISPAGAIPEDSPAGRYLISKGVRPENFNSFGSRRGNHEVMMRGTFGNIRIKNLITPDKTGGYSIHFPSGEMGYIYDIAEKYKKENIPLVIAAGKEYGSGSSRDWAAKGTALLGVKAVIAESFERIHRSNLIGMGVLPIQFADGNSWQDLELTGKEIIFIDGIEEEKLTPNKNVRIRVLSDEKAAREICFQALLRLDSPVEIKYYKNGGILQTVLRELLKN